MQANLCRHIKTNGLQCRGVALTDHHFCYFHRRLNQTHAQYRHKIAGRPSLIDEGSIIELPALEDTESVQLAISKVVHALAVNAIDAKRAAILLYGLQLAARNARNLVIVSHPTELVREIHRTDDIGSSATDIAAPGLTCTLPAEQDRPHPPSL